MGVSSYCIESTVSIAGRSTAAALQALKNAGTDLAFLGVDGLESCRNLLQALQVFAMDGELRGEDVVNIRFAGGKGDNSMFLWPILAPFIDHGGFIKMSVEGDTEVTVFENGEFFSRYEDDGEDDVPLSEAVSDFFEKLADDTIDADDIARILEVEGHLNFVDGQGDTPLMRVCACARVDVDEDVDDDADDDEEADDVVDYMALAQRLLATDPDLDVVNKAGDTALTLAIASNNLPLFKMLLDKGAALDKAALDPVEAAADALNVDIIDMLALQGLVPAATEALNRACATHEFEARKLPLVRHLVETYGCDIDRPAEHDTEVWDGQLRRGATPLMAAALTDDANVVAYLLAAQADPLIGDAALNTALHYCSGQTWIGGDCSVAWFARGSNGAVIEALLKAGANPAARNAAGHSCSDLAASAGNEGALRLFAQH